VALRRLWSSLAIASTVDRPSRVRCGTPEGNRGIRSRVSRKAGSSIAAGVAGSASSILPNVEQAASGFERISGTATSALRPIGHRATGVFALVSVGTSRLAAIVQTATGRSLVIGTAARYCRDPASEQIQKFTTVRATVSHYVMSCRMHPESAVQVTLKSVLGHF
jgi:hypothetical protein